MRKYEFVFLTQTGLKKDKLEAIFSDLEKEFKNSGGKVEKREDWGKKSLVYPIKKQNEADFWIWWLVFKDKIDLSSVNTFLSREKDIIRYLFLKEAKKRRKDG